MEHLSPQGYVTPARCLLRGCVIGCEVRGGSFTCHASNTLSSSPLPRRSSSSLLPPPHPPSPYLLSLFLLLLPPGAAYQGHERHSKSQECLVRSRVSSRGLAYLVSASRLEPKQAIRRQTVQSHVCQAALVQSTESTSRAMTVHSNYSIVCQFA